LARVLVRETKIDQARKEYMAFLAAWKNADADLKLVGDARRELAELH
jgi:thioredoxin-like negative regulator of GroEL